MGLVYALPPHSFSSCSTSVLFLGFFSCPLYIYILRLRLSPVKTRGSGSNLGNLSQIHSCRSQVGIQTCWASLLTTWDLSFARLLNSLSRRSKDERRKQTSVKLVIILPTSWLQGEWEKTSCCSAYCACGCGAFCSDYLWQAGRVVRLSIANTSWDYQRRQEGQSKTRVKLLKTS